MDEVDVQVIEIVNILLDYVSPALSKHFKYIDYKDEVVTIKPVLTVIDATPADKARNGGVPPF